MSYNFADIAPPGVNKNYATGINDVGQIVGYFYDAWFELGYLYSESTYSTVSVPSQGFLVDGGTTTLVSDHANYTEPSAINEAGDIVGTFGNHSIYPIFLYSGGIYTDIRPGIGFFSTGINDTAEIVGSFWNFSPGSSSYVGFLQKDDAYTVLQHPLAVKGTFANDINNNGQVVGYYLDANYIAHGFLYSDGDYSTIDLASGGTYLTGINDKGEIVGEYRDNSGVNHGFLISDSIFTTIDNPLGVKGTALTGINNNGQIVGNYFDVDGGSHGFVATTAPIQYGPLAFSSDTAGTIVYANEYGVLPDPTQTYKLIAFATTQYAYGQQVGVMDPAVYAYEALGMALASTATYFQNTFGPSNPSYSNTAAGDAQFAADAYASVFGHSGTSAQVAHFVAQLDFFEAIYTASGSYGDAANVNLLAKGATYGQMLGVQSELIEVPLIGVSAPFDATHGASLG